MSKTWNKEVTVYTDCLNADGRGDLVICSDCEELIKYYYERYHTGNINTIDTRTATIYADNRGEAVKKVKEADDDFVCSKKHFF